MILLNHKKRGYNMTYVELVKQSLENNKDEILLVLSDKGVDLDDTTNVAETISENFTNDDSITGNLSGSFTLSRDEARDIVSDNIDDVVTILNELGYNAMEEIGKAFVEDSFEQLDVTARVFVLNEATYQFAQELTD